MPGVLALTANGRTAARPNNQPSGGPGHLVADDLPGDHPGVGPNRGWPSRPAGVCRSPRRYSAA
jgi:hypothetical protein